MIATYMYLDCLIACRVHLLAVACQQSTRYKHVTSLTFVAFRPRQATVRRPRRACAEAAAAGHAVPDAASAAGDVTSATGDVTSAATAVDITSATAGDVTSAAAVDITSAAAGDVTSTAAVDVTSAAGDVTSASLLHPATGEHHDGDAHVDGAAPRVGRNAEHGLVARVPDTAPAL